MNIEHISASRKQVWDLCQAQYKYKYHLQMAIEGEEQFYFTYGKMVHKVAEVYVKSQGLRTINDVAADVLNGVIPLEENKLAPSLFGEYKDKFPVHLRAIQKLCEKIGFDGKVEHKFNYDLNPPNNKCITGFIDRLIIRGDKYYIIDYKTSKKNAWRKTKRTIVNDLQLRCYARVVQKEFFAKPENIRAALYYVEGPELIDTRFTEESLEMIEKEMLESYLTIEAADPDQVWGNIGYHCNRCDWKEACPFFQTAGIK